jgi:hypothetical protein
MSIENNPSQGLTMDQAMEQLRASHNQTPEEEQLEEGLEEEVVEVGSEEESELEPEESDDDDQDETEGEGEEDTDEAADEEVFEVEIDGELTEVTGDELVKGYLRHNDYTRKRQADAKRAKELESDYQGKLGQLDQMLTQNISSEELQMQQIQQQYNSVSDDATRQQLHYQYLQLQQAVQGRTAQQQRVQQQLQLAQQAQAEANLKEQLDLLNVQFENWDTKKEELAGYLSNKGFDDLSMFVDARMAELVDKAKQFDELQQTRETVVKSKLKRKVPKTVKAGQGEQKFNVDQQKVSKLSNNFNESRSLKDALALLQAKRTN